MPNSVVLSSEAIERPAIGAHTAIAQIRGVEWVILCFLIYSAIAAELLPIPSEAAHRVILLNSIVILFCGLLVLLDRGKGALAPGIARDWMPLAVLEFVYQEMGWFVTQYHDHALEGKWVTWDRLFLNGGAKAAIEVFGPVLPSVLEVSYSLVYTLGPISLAALYLYRRRDRVDRFLIIFVTGVLLCYAQFPFWPSEPPRTLFAGQDFPAFDTIFRRFNFWLLGNYGIHTSVFPSAHVGAAFAAAFGMSRALPERKWLGRALFGIALFIALATVYGRYHYLADAAAGLLMAIVALALSWLLEGKVEQPQPASNTDIGERWCILMHHAPMWPIHGYYRCRTCGRRFPFP